MMLLERTLRKWRGESLRLKKDAQEGLSLEPSKEKILIINERVLQMTQKLLDQHLLRRKE